MRLHDGAGHVFACRPHHDVCRAPYAGPQSVIRPWFYHLCSGVSPLQLMWEPNNPADLDDSVATVLPKATGI